MILVLTCNCGSVEQKARTFLKKVGYPDWLNIQIYKGKDKTKRAIQYIPHYPEVDMLNHFLESASKYVVILGYDGNECRWSDIAHNYSKSAIDAEFIVKRFA